MTIHDHTWPCHHGKEQPPRRWKAPGFWFSDVSCVWKAPTGSPRNFRQVKVKTPWIFQEFERLQMGFSENRAARDSNGLPDYRITIVFPIEKKPFFLMGIPSIFKQIQTARIHGIVVATDQIYEFQLLNSEGQCAARKWHFVMKGTVELFQ